MTTSFLKGSRFNEQANEVFRLSQDDFEKLDFKSDEFIKLLERFINRHKAKQLPRLKELKRYYLSDNNINYRSSKTDEDAADNRISSDFARYISIFEQGYMFGKPVEYKNENEELMGKIWEFQTQTNEAYHNVLIKTDLSIYGRAYELVHIEGDENDVSVKVTKLDAEQTFIVYDDTVRNNSLFAVRYYSFEYDQSERRDFAEVYTSDTIYSYANDKKDAGKGLSFKGADDHNFNGVPVNEFANNEDRTGAYEAVLDTIDAYDLSQSELANYQQDTIDAMLVITGNPYTGTDEKDFDDEGNINPNSKLGVTKAFKKARIMILDDNPNPDGAKPGAFYLVKEYDSEGAEKYKERLVNDILRFTFTPDVTDGNFGGVQSGESMKYKLMASDNRRVTQERLFGKGLMRRLRLAVNIWKIKGNEKAGYEQINETNIIFSPNVPQNTSELITNIKNLYGVISDETTLELLAQFTGVDSDDELKRLQTEQIDSIKLVNDNPRRPASESVESTDEGNDTSKTGS